MKILFITPEGFDTPNPNNQMAMVMIKDFLKSGNSVHLIQSRRKKINPEIPEILINEEKLTYDTITRKDIDKSKFIKRYINEMKFAFSSFKKWKKIKDCDVVFVQSCPTVIFTLILLKIFIRKPIVYNIYDIFPGHAFDVGVIKNKSIYKFLKFINRYTYKLGDIITVLSDDMKLKVIDEKALSNKVRVVPAWYDVNSVKEISLNQNKFLKKYNLPLDKFYVQYAGTIGYVFDYKAILFAAKSLFDNKDIVFHIIGDGNMKQQFMKEAEEKKLSNIHFFPLQPLELVPDVYSACSISVIPLKRGVIGNGVPSKAPLLMACGRVIINSVEEESQYYKMFNDNNIGISVSNDKYYDLPEKILFLYNNRSIINDMAKNAKLFAELNYSNTLSTTKFIKIFEELICK